MSGSTPKNSGGATPTTVICAAWGVLTAPVNIENRQFVLGTFIISASVAWKTWKGMQWVVSLGTHACASWRWWSYYIKRN
jgi:hypothetical protein